MARGFRIQAQTRGSLSLRTIQLQQSYGLSLEQARCAVRMIGANAVVDFDGCDYTDEETPEGLVTETHAKSNRAQSDIYFHLLLLTVQEA